MGCGCGSGGSGAKYEVTTASGQKIEVSSRTEALAIVRQQGGTWAQK